MPSYAIALTSSPAVAADPTDLVEITASTKSDFLLTGIVLSRVSTAGVGTTAVEHPLLQILRGSSANAGTATGIARNIDSMSKTTATFLINLGTTAIGSAGSTVHRLLSVSFNTLFDSFMWMPPKDQRPSCKLGERLSVRIGPRANALVMTGTIFIEEIGKRPGLSDR